MKERPGTHCLHMCVIAATFSVKLYCLLHAIHTENIRNTKLHVEYRDVGPLPMLVFLMLHVTSYRWLACCCQPVHFERWTGSVVLWNKQTYQAQLLETRIPRHRDDGDIILCSCSGLSTIPPEAELWRTLQHHGNIVIWKDVPWIVYILVVCTYLEFYYVPLKLGEMSRMCKQSVPGHFFVAWLWDLSSAC